MKSDMDHWVELNKQEQTTREEANAADGAEAGNSHQ